MKDYIIVTDSSADLSVSELKERGVRFAELTFRFDREEYSNYEMDISEFYQRMRDGGAAKTAAVNTEVFYSLFSRAVEEGYDVLYIGFSSGLSTTYNSARLAMNALADEHPEAKLYAVDTLAASLGVAMIVDYALDKKATGATIEEVRDYVESIKMKVAHRFTVDDLVYLKRGGRVSGAEAFVGNLLGIKPVLHVDNLGHLVPIGKVRGRHNALLSLCDTIGKYALEGTRVYISHSDCYEDAKKLRDMIEEKHGYKTDLISDVGPVIGAHSGPGTLALFFLATER